MSWTVASSGICTAADCAASALALGYVCLLILCYIVLGFDIGDHRSRVLRKEAKSNALFWKPQVKALMVKNGKKASLQIAGSKFIADDIVDTYTST